MKFLILCFAIFASNQLVRVQAVHDHGSPRCEVTEAALAELAELRRIVGQLTTLVETLVGEPIAAAGAVTSVTDQMPCEVRGQPLLHQGELRLDECTICTCDNGTAACNIECPPVTSFQDQRPCEFQGKPLRHEEELPMDECTVCTCNNGTVTCDIDCPGERVEVEPVDELIDATLSYTWKEATVSWTMPSEEVFGYIVKVFSEGGEELTRLSPFETSFTTTDISTHQNYTIEVTPVMSDGPGTKYTTEIFRPVCPNVCTFEYDPVCATDGNTYSNMCAFDIAQCETGDATLAIDYAGACDPCLLVQCGVPLCPEGFVVAEEPLPGECCVGCVDRCTLIACLEPICPEGFVVAEIPLYGECCVECVDRCTIFACGPPVCGDGYTVGAIDGECCAGCIRTVFEDCSDAQAEGMTNNGAYLIQPAGIDTPFEVLCDLENEGGRWTVILRRVESEVNFLRGYDEYVEGFGDASDAYWIGLENLYRLNKLGNTKMLIKGTDHLGETATGNYNIFRVGPAADNYALETIVGFRGDIGNALAYNKGAAFSAPDRDNDNGSRDCASDLGGGWWYKGDICTRANPLGEFITPDDFALERGIFWAPFKGKGKSLQFLEIRIRPV